MDRQIFPELLNVSHQFFLLNMPPRLQIPKSNQSFHPPGSSRLSSRHPRRKWSGYSLASPPATSPVRFCHSWEYRPYHRIDELQSSSLHNPRSVPAMEVSTSSPYDPLRCHHPHQSC